jgi:hypothetical protein
MHSRGQLLKGVRTKYNEEGHTGDFLFKSISHSAHSELKDFAETEPCPPPETTPPTIPTNSPTGLRIGRGGSDKQFETLACLSVLRLASNGK